MGSFLKQSISGNIHRIREFELEKVSRNINFNGQGYLYCLVLKRLPRK